MKKNDYSKPDIFNAVERKDEHHIERHMAILKRIKKLPPIGLIFLGDSIIRRWQEVPELWNYYFSKYNPINFGVGSDTIQNLKWRILNGELDHINPKILVLLIGTNNLPLYNELEISDAIQDIINIIHQKLPDTKIILMGLLPRNPDDSSGDYMKIIYNINSRLEEFEKNDYVHFLDIGRELIDSDGKLDIRLAPDGLHLVEPGYKIWGELLIKVIEKDLFSY